jgi:acetyl esterase
MPLDPQAQALVDQLAQVQGPKLEDVPPPEARDLFRAFNQLLPTVETARQADYQVPVDGGEVTVRVFWPLGAPDDVPDGLPVVVWFHGGGFTVGDLATSDPTAAEVANQSGCVVANVDYRLSPEHAFPVPLEDCYAAVQWVIDNAGSLGVNPARVAVGGDSAGGNLATAVCLLAGRRGGPSIRFQALLYPCLDAQMSYPSMKENGEGYFLTASTMRWFWNNYLAGGASAEDPLLSPIYAPDSELAGLPPALMVTAEYDPLRDEGEAYAERMRQAGAIVEASRYDGQIHGFVGLFSIFDAGAKAVDELARALRAAL